MTVLIKVGEQIGALNTVALVVLTAFIGVAMLRQQGLATLLRANQRMSEGSLPAEELLEGIFLAVGGALLLTPGFVTDAIGFTLLTPGFRKMLAKTLLAKMIESGQSKVHSGQAYYSNQGQDFKASNSEPGVLEGEYQDVTASNAEKDSKDA